MRIISDIFAYTSARDAEIQLDLDLRLPHAGSGRDAGPRTRLHPCRRRRVYPRRPCRGAHHRPLRTAPVVLLGDRHELLHGGRQAAGGAAPVGEARQGLRAAQRQVARLAHPLPDVRLVAHRAGRVQQRDAHLHRGDGRDPGAHAVSAHQRPRRGAGAADRFFRPHRPQHAALPAAGERHDAHHRPVGRLLLCRAAYRGPRRARLRPYPRGRGARRHDEGDRGRDPETEDRGGCGADPGADRFRPAEDHRRQHLPRVRRSVDRASEGRQRMRSAPARSTSSRGCAPSAAKPRSRRRLRHCPTAPHREKATFSTSP